MTTVAPPTTAPAGPYAALRAQARCAPQGEALRSRRRGQWRAWSWQRLAAQAELAARGWTALGVLPGDRIIALGPLGADLIVTLFAADALGATVVLPHADVQAQVVGEARFAFADGTHELERLLRHRGSTLRAAVVADAAVVPASGQLDQVQLISTAQLFTAGRNHSALSASANTDRPPIAVAVDHDGTEHTPGAHESTAPDLSLADRVFADFDPTWLVGVDFILHAWPVSAPLLLIPEPHGDAVADQRDARANIWLASPERLAAAVAALMARLASQGLGARVARALLEGRRSVLGGLARWRIRAGMGLSATRHTISNARVAEATAKCFAALGIAPHTAEPAAVAARNVAAGPDTTGRAFDRTLVTAP